MQCQMRVNSGSVAVSFFWKYLYNMSAPTENSKLSSIVIDSTPQESLEKV